MLALAIGLMRRLWSPLRRARLTIKGLAAFGILSAVAVGVVAGLLQLKTDAGPESFLPSHDPALSALHDADNSFGADPIVVLAQSAKPRALLSTAQLPKLLNLEGELSRLPNVAVVYGPATVLNQIAGSARDLIATLSGKRDAVAAAAAKLASDQGASKQAIVAASNAATAAFDERYGSLLVRGLPAGLPTLRNEGFISAVIFDKSGAPKPQWKFVVPLPDTVSILVRPREGIEQADAEALVAAVRSTVNGAGLATSQVTVTGVSAVTAGLGAQIRREMPTIGLLAVGLIATCYLMMPWIRQRRYRLVPLATTLCATALLLSVLGWLNRPLSLGVIAFLPILLGIASDYPAYLAHPGRRRPVIVAAFASAGAFASLAISSVPFVRELGLALAVGLLLALGLALVISSRLAHGEATSQPPPQVRSRPTGAIQVPRLSALPRSLALVAVSAAAAFGWCALPHLSIEAQPDKLAAGLPAMTDIQHAQDVLGGSGEVEVMLTGPNVVSPAALGWMDQAQAAIALNYGGQVRPIVSPSSLLSFLGPTPTADQIAAGLQLLPDYLTASVIRNDHLRAAMSYLLDLQDLRDQQRVLDGVSSVLPKPPSGYRVALVGLPVLADKGYQLLSGSRYLTSTIGIACAGVVLLIGLKRRTTALRAVLAACLATGWGLAAIAALGVSLTPLSLGIGSLTTATACEFTVMLAAAAAASGSQLRRTVVAAAIAAALGFAALSASGLTMVRDFGLLLAGTVVLALAAAHLVVTLLPQSDPSRRPELARAEIPLRERATL